MIPINPAVKWIGLVAGMLLLAGAVVIFAIVHSNRRQTSASFQVLNRVVDGVALNQVGQVVDDEQSGRSSISSDQPTRTVIILSRETPSALQAAIEARLSRSGFAVHSWIWQWTDHHNAITVTMTALHAGGKLPASSSIRTISPGQTGLRVDFTITPS